MSTAVEEQTDREARRAEVWRRQLAEIEGTDWAGLQRQARADLEASIRGDLAVSPVTAVYRVTMLEWLADRMQAERGDLQGWLGLPVTARASGAPRLSMGGGAGELPNPLRVLADAIGAEVSRTVNAETERMRAEVLAAWSGDDDQAERPVLDPSRYTYLQDRVRRIGDLIAQAEQNIAQALPVSGGDDVNARQTHERSRDRDREELAELRGALVTARQDLAEFRAGRVT